MIYIYTRLPPTRSPPNGMGPQVAPRSSYLQAIGSISEVQPRIWISKCMYMYMCMYM
jgi:hypothetical protein